MKIWLTPPFSEGEIQEAELLVEQANGDIEVLRDGVTSYSHGWWKKGKTWHLDYDQARTAARSFRNQRIAEHEAALVKLRAVAAKEEIA